MGRRFRVRRSIEAHRRCEPNSGETLLISFNSPFIGEFGLRKDRLRPEQPESHAAISFTS